MAAQTFLKHKCIFGAHDIRMEQDSPGGLKISYTGRGGRKTLAAATVLLLRNAESDGTLEVLMTRRSAQASFAPGAYVFPGGGIDALDAHPATHAVAARRPTQSDEHLTEAIAAIRESFEELGILLARHADGRMAGNDDIAASIVL